MTVTDIAIVEELGSIIASLNQISKNSYSDLGSTKRSIEANFDALLGWREAPFIAASKFKNLTNSDNAIQELESLRTTKKDWSISLTHEFVKNTKNIDRKLQGRVLEALMDLVKSPMELRGDSCKPLVGDLSGLWRIRIGDVRLIYKPDPNVLTVYCLSLAARGSAYT